MGIPSLLRVVPDHDTYIHRSNTTTKRLTHITARARRSSLRTQARCRGEKCGKPAAVTEHRAKAIRKWKAMQTGTRLTHPENRLKVKRGLEGLWSSAQIFE